MIEVQNLSRCYGKTQAVDNVSFSIEQNQVVGLLGPNGAGKSTIMKMISGGLEPTRGTVIFDGQALEDSFRPLQRELGYLPEALPAYPDLCVADYLDYAATLKGIPREERKHAVSDALSALDLRQRALDSIRTLSRGMKQRVGVAQAILTRPRLLILDEPTNGLDPEQTEDMRKLIRQLARRATVILSTHILQEVEAVCDRVLVLSRGRLVLDDSVAQLRRCGALWLRTDNDNSALVPVLEDIIQVNRVSRVCGSEFDEFTLTLEPGADIDDVSDQVMQTLVTRGARLYQIERLSRDLDTIFRESTVSEERAQHEA